MRSLYIFEIHIKSHTSFVPEGYWKGRCTSRTLSFWVWAATPTGFIMAMKMGISPRGLPTPPAILIPRESLGPLVNSAVLVSWCSGSVSKKHVGMPSLQFIFSYGCLPHMFHDLISVLGILTIWTPTQFVRVIRKVSRVWTRLRGHLGAACFTHLKQRYSAL